MDQPVSKRLTRDYEMVANEGPPMGIFVRSKTNSITVLRMMLVGPKGPYENCLFFFDIDFPKPYPINSPHVTFHCPYSIRAHPNLYQGRAGKVCLSILGTWAGEPWTPMMTLMTIAQTILMILDDTPLRNEPGYVNSSLATIQPYTDYVQYVCLKESVNLYRQALTGSLPAEFADFGDAIMSNLINRKERINAQIAELMTKTKDKYVDPHGFYGNKSYVNEKYFIEPI